MASSPAESPDSCNFQCSLHLRTASQSSLQQLLADLPLMRMRIEELSSCQTTSKSHRFPSEKLNMTFCCLGEKKGGGGGGGGGKVGRNSQIGIAKPWWLCNAEALANAQGNCLSEQISLLEAHAGLTCQQCLDHSNI